MTFIENNPELVFLCGFFMFYLAIQWLEPKSAKSLLAENLDAPLSEHLFGGHSSESRVEDEKTIAELQKRVAVLEKIVTDSRYELDQKLKEL